MKGVTNSMGLKELSESHISYVMIIDYDKANYLT